MSQRRGWAAGAESDSTGLHGHREPDGPIVLQYPPQPARHGHRHRLDPTNDFTIDSEFDSDTLGLWSCIYSAVKCFFDIQSSKSWIQFTSLLIGSRWWRGASSVYVWQDILHFLLMLKNGRSNNRLLLRPWESPKVWQMPIMYCVCLLCLSKGKRKLLDTDLKHKKSNNSSHAQWR